MSPLRLGVNIDHVATLRNARGGLHPDPLRAARAAIEAGADGITAHLREDRRHIRDQDMAALAELCADAGAPLNFEMAVTDEMVEIAKTLRPHAVCLVPEKREERTTEGGLDVLRARAAVGRAVRELADAGARVSLFVEADLVQLEVAAAVGAAVVELHTGAFCDAVREGRSEEANQMLASLRDGARQAASLGLEVHAGHGIDFDTVAAIASIPEVIELNIGHFLIGEAVFVGLEEAVRRMRALMSQVRQEPAA